MRRVALVVVLAMSYVLAPLVAGAQPAPKLVRVGLLISTASTVSTDNVEAFKKGLLEFGHVEGKTFLLLPRYGEAGAKRYPG